MTKYVMAFNGARDHYQFALALAEAGKLERLVTDYYTPDWLNPLLAKRGILKNRHTPDLKSRDVAMSLGSLIERYKLKRNGLPSYGWMHVDREIGKLAGKIARETGAVPFTYSNYAYWAFEGNEDRNRVMYQYHPHPLSCYDILKDDFEAHPCVRESFFSEQDSKRPDLHPPERTEEWKRASHIICASSFSKRSLIMQGADPAQIYIVPLGGEAAGEVIEQPRNDKCEFLFVGQGVQRKGLHHLILAWQKAAIGNARLTLVCSRLDPGIRALATAANIEILPRQEKAELDAIFRRSDVFVMPSLVEGFGLVYLEALSTGLYTIGTDNTGLPDLDLPDFAAESVPPGDIDAIATALENALSKWKSGQISKPAIAATASQHNWQTFRTRIAERLAFIEQQT